MQQALEPVAVADVRAFLSLNVHDTEEDALLSMLIAGARARAETYLRRTIAPQTVTVTTGAGPVVELPDTPAYVQEVLLDADGATTDVTARTRVTGRYLHTPFGRMRNALLTITYTSEEYCPPDVRQALLVMVRNSYTERGSDPFTEDVRAMLAPHRTVRV